MSYIVVDVESDDQSPAAGSIVCFGAVLVSDMSKTFYGKVKPITDKWNQEALAISGFSREQHNLFDDPKTVMLEFDKWIQSVSYGKPTLLAIILLLIGSG